MEKLNKSGLVKPFSCFETKLYYYAAKLKLNLQFSHRYNNEKFWQLCLEHPTIGLRTNRTWTHLFFAKQIALRQLFCSPTLTVS